MGVPRLEMVTRLRLVSKNRLSSPKNGDEIAFRRQKSDFIASKWRREFGSSAKLSVHRLKRVTRTDLVFKKQHFSPQIGDEEAFRRQKTALISSKW
jgi:hypothetical protein